MRLLYIILSLLFIACEKPSFYISEKAFEQSVWNYEDLISFDFPIDDTTSIYSMELDLKHGQEYQYENIYLKVFTDFPSLEDQEEQLNIQLADKKGKWVGKCNKEGCKVKVYLLDRFKFPEPGNYKLSFEQYTRNASLDQIESITLIINKHQHEK